MDRPQHPVMGTSTLRRGALAALLMLAGFAAPVTAQQVITADVKPGQTSSEVLLTSGAHGPGIIPHQSLSMPLGCYGCGGLGCGGCGDCGGGCGGPGCIPGRLDCCEPCQGRTMLGRLLCGLHHILCCPDPCYEPCYIPAANAGFFLDSAKPVTQSKFRFDASIGGTTPDRAEYLWAQIGGRGPANPEASLVHYDLVMENEFATERFSFFVSTPFRIVVPTNNPTHAGYADMRLGTKSLLVDSELLLVAFQFSTILPTGVAPWGTGNGHVSLEPSLLMTLKVCEETYLQTQIAEWIPLGGTPGFQGPVFHYHFSLNHTLTAPRRDMKLIGTMEFGSYVFHSGGATLANGAVVNASDEVYYHLGPGFRFHFCNKIDIGFGMQFGVSDNMFFDQLYRTELRWRF